MSHILKLHLVCRPCKVPTPHGSPALILSIHIELGKNHAILQRNLATQQSRNLATQQSRNLVTQQSCNLATQQSRNLATQQ
jgi:hypothetical protein